MVVEFTSNAVSSYTSWVDDNEDNAGGSIFIVGPLSFSDRNGRFAGIGATTYYGQLTGNARTEVKSKFPQISRGDYVIISG